MSLSIEETLHVWARGYLIRRGVPYQDGDKLTVESAELFGGGSGLTGYDITNLRTLKRVRVERYFSEIIQELTDISKEYAE